MRILETEKQEEGGPPGMQLLEERLIVFEVASEGTDFQRDCKEGTDAVGHWVDTGQNRPNNCQQLTGCVTSAWEGGVNQA